MTPLTDDERACLRWVHDYGLEHGRGPRPHEFSVAQWGITTKGLRYGWVATRNMWPHDAHGETSHFVTPLGLALLERAESGLGGRKEDSTNKHVENIGTDPGESTREVCAGEACSVPRQLVADVTFAAMEAYALLRTRYSDGVFGLADASAQASELRRSAGIDE